MKPIAFLAWMLLLPASLALGQKPLPQLPCDFPDELVRTTEGKIVQYTSDEMKQRATHKVDVSDFMKRTDIKGTIIVDVLVGVSGNVVCMKSLIGHPIISAEVEKALHSWTFEPAKARGQPVGYLGRLQFTLCNTSCGKDDSSVTIVK